MYRGDDILKIYDQDLNNIGRATREEVHTQGLLHSFHQDQNVLSGSGRICRDIDNTF